MLRIVQLALAIVTLSGCTAYRFGVGSLYPIDVRTVHVPVFESESFRRNLGEQLTEAVVKEIESKTGYKVVSEPGADSVLAGRIVEDRKHVLVENRFDDVRELEYSIHVQVTWSRRDGTLLAQNLRVPIDPSLVDVVGSTPIVPEAGQSIATGQQKALRKVAQQIVGLMDAPW